MTTNAKKVTRSQDPYKAFRFIVEINGTEIGGFSDVDRPGSSH